MSTLSEYCAYRQGFEDGASRLIQSAPADFGDERVREAYRLGWTDGHDAVRQALDLFAKRIGHTPRIRRTA